MTAQIIISGEGQAKTTINVSKTEFDLLQKIANEINSPFQEAYSPNMIVTEVKTERITGRENMIAALKELVSMYGERLNVEIYDLWLNNSDNGEGEDILVSAITDKGLEMADGDFWEYDQLDDEDLEMILEEVYYDE